jgi:hypothetical protein
MNLLTLETAVLRAAIGLVRRAVRDSYLPGEDALEPHQRDAERVLDSLDELEIALLQLDVAVARTPLGRLPF